MDLADDTTEAQSDSWVEYIAKQRPRYACSILRMNVDVSGHYTSASVARRGSDMPLPRAGFELLILMHTTSLVHQDHRSTLRARRIDPQIHVNHMIQANELLLLPQTITKRAHVSIKDKKSPRQCLPLKRVTNQARSDSKLSDV